MWPNRRMGQFMTPQEIQEESDDEAFHVANAPVDLLLSSLDTYAAVQRTSAMRPMPCDCTEVLSVRSTEMASTSYVGSDSPYPRMMYYRNHLERTSTPEINVNTPNRQNDGEEPNLNNVPLNNFAREPLNEVELSPIMIRRTSRHTKPVHVARSRHLPTPEPSPARRRRAAHKMTAATLLDSHVANSVVKYARCIINMYDRDMGCLNCGLLPICPITGQCGHTRCSQCVLDKITCPCGNDSSRELYVNILIRDLVEKISSDRHTSRSTRIVSVPTSVSTEHNRVGISADTTAGIQVHPLSGASTSSCGPSHLKRRARAGTPHFGGHKRIPISPRARYNHALDLLRLGQHREAVPYLALAAASGQPDLRQARILLARAITVLSSNNSNPRCLTTQLNRSVRRLSSTSCISPRDMECILCCDTFTNPVTTPCGHMYCRKCLERTLHHGRKCPLCLRDLYGLILSETGNTLFVQSALKSINAIATPLPLSPDLIPIFVCTVAYPSVPCPLFIFDPRYWLMIRRVLESGSRRFGMVACDRKKGYVDYGTILEVRDCVHLEDGRSIISTIGLSRFKVIERGIRDGCQVARILPITDTIPRNHYKVRRVKALAHRIMFKSMLWLSRLNAKVLADIEATFGTLQVNGFFDYAWWESTDGPSWLWWLIAILPLRSEIKVLILSTDCLVKRLMAVSRTLDSVDQDRTITDALERSEVETSAFELPLPSDDDNSLEHERT